MPYRISYTNRFKKDVKRCFKRGLKMEKLQAAIDILSSEGSLPASYKPHPLSGNHAIRSISRLAHTKGPMPLASLSRMGSLM